MFDEPLPKHADVRKLASREASFVAKLDVTHLPRIDNIVLDGVQFVAIDLQFAIDDQRVKTIQGKINAKLQVECQRCMEPVAIDVHSDVNLAIVWDEEQAKKLRRDCDPLIVGEDELVNLNEVVEDELLLSVPFVSYHDPADCRGTQNYESLDPSSADKPAVEEETTNPFSVLASLKSGK
ncbi:Large ribosomal RNA subunit accumulation protein YceD [BD1-7 clade bacterium]|uniref:Large ribosomal RNA subunit accumulation protein YceD n=1 Tax=BD1-7 clade bacterium TaxID=2029982 RepID=A0A5S9QL66_9GAMM|nr:Large ribosomal RNA subunit accumulation protein YceD [BD1-7 clade bacterium]CAA0115986.1 Large ribosomal RNA subunit accumulation protein YceD [BD1-7 clade bacterium]CAA0119642.1 Large ribosomal RNA subunit accumulation protein YceD [BD1-7 clade bacterium]